MKSRICWLSTHKEDRSYDGEHAEKDPYFFWLRWILFLPVMVVVFVGTGILSFMIGSAFNMQNILWGMFHVRLPG